jgi:hypothetical protein
MALAVLGKGPKMATERSNFLKLVDAAIERGCTISVNDGEDFPVKRSQDGAAIFAAANAVGEASLIVRYENGVLAGTILVVWGNSPEELFADYSDNAFIGALVDKAVRS